MSYFIKGIIFTPWVRFIKRITVINSYKGVFLVHMKRNMEQRRTSGRVRLKKQVRTAQSNRTGEGKRGRPKGEERSGEWLHGKVQRCSKRE